VRLCHLSEPYGKLHRVNVVTDRGTGRSRGFVFVEMADSAEADRTIAALNVNEARLKGEGGGRQRREARW
jgi:RNA recognition motif-containing protein